MNLLKIITRLITSNLFFFIFLKLEESSENKNAQEKAVHFYFSGGFTLSNSEKKYMVGIKYTLLNI